MAVTDGEGSHPGSVAAGRLDLGRVRAFERAEALRRLLPVPPPVTRLGLPDGGVADYRARLASALSAQLRPGYLLIAPWWRDGHHPDHDAVGGAAREVAAEVGCAMVGFLVWAWHWAVPDGEDLPWADCRRLPLSRRDLAHRRWATSAFASQIRPIGPDPADRAVLPAAMLRRSWRRNEVFVTVPPDHA